MRHSGLEVPRIWSGAAVLVGLLGGCGSNSDDIPACSEASVTLAVSDEARPVFTWTPVCGAAALFVRPGDGVGATWWIQTLNSANSLEPGIAYGVLPEGAGTNEPPLPLVDGREYQVSLLIITQVPGGQEVREAGATTFVK